MRMIGSILSDHEGVLEEAAEADAADVDRREQKNRAERDGFCSISESGVIELMAAANATASAAIEPEDERKKFVKPHMKATRWP